MVKSVCHMQEILPQTPIERCYPARVACQATAYNLGWRWLGGSWMRLGLEKHEAWHDEACLGLRLEHGQDACARLIGYDLVWLNPSFMGGL